jgi:two-component system response regulator PilR (NtrC family)
LENVIERLCAVEERETITLSSLSADIVSNRPMDNAGPPGLPSGFNLEAHLDQVAKTYIQEAGAAASGNMRRMAELLGISYRSLRYLSDKYQIKPFRGPEAREERNGGESTPRQP